VLPTSLAVTPDGSVLIGQSALGDGGVWAYEGDGWQPLPDSPACVGEMVVDGEGTLWAVRCGRDGLYQRRDGAWQALSAADGLPEGGIVDIGVSGTRTVVVATKNGIGYLSAVGWAVHGRTWEGDVREMAAAPDGSIWLATSRGAVRVRLP
jgi:ligand-binding sensor domain-containing protein